MRMKRFWLRLMVILCMLSSVAAAATKEQIDEGVTQTLSKLSRNVRFSEMLETCAGILVFPSVVKAGLVLGAEYGEGVLQVGGKTVDYYSIAAGSLGLQAGLQQRAQVTIFLDPAVLERFQNSEGIKAGLDGSLIVWDEGMGKVIGSDTYNQPVTTIVLVHRGLMANVSVEGVKYAKIKR